MNAVSGTSALNDESSKTQPTAGSTPGALLRQEREQRGLTVQQVSEELHLDAWLVEALEQNRFLALGAPVYAKGHLRKYAVLLGLSPELILARYQEIAEPPPPPQLPPREALLTPDPMGRGIDWRRLVPKLDWRGVNGRTFAIIGAVLVVSGGLWLATSVLRSSNDAAPQVAQSPVQAPAQSSAQVAPATPAAEPAASPPAAAQPVPSAGPATPPATSAVRLQPSNRPAAGPPPQSEPAKVALAKPTPARPAVTPPVQAGQPKTPPATSPGPRVAATQPPPTAPKLAAGPAVPATVPTPVPEIPQVSLRLEFAVASWAEVYDGDGRRLLYAVGDPSRPRTIAGKPPLKVTLGQAGSVQARVNGRPIAIPRRIGQESASFSIGANGSIR